jgi:hypothetical protein
MNNIGLKISKGIIKRRNLKIQDNSQKWDGTPLKIGGELPYPKK